MLLENYDWEINEVLKHQIVLLTCLIYCTSISVKVSEDYFKPRIFVFLVVHSNKLKAGFKVGSTEYIADKMHIHMVKYVKAGAFTDIHCGGFQLRILLITVLMQPGRLYRGQTEQNVLS